MRRVSRGSDVVQCEQKKCTELSQDHEDGLEEHCKKRGE